MRAVVQRVVSSSVRVDGELVGSIGRGLNVLVGVGHDDDERDAAALAEKVLGLRIFPDADDKMNLSVTDVGGEMLLISQFTLHGDARKGKRPSFTAAMAPDPARELFEKFVVGARASGLYVATGRFRADMQVSIENDGPVTLLIDTKRLF